MNVRTEDTDVVVLAAHPSSIVGYRLSGPVEREASVYEHPSSARLPPHTITTSMAWAVQRDMPSIKSPARNFMLTASRRIAGESDDGSFWRGRPSRYRQPVKDGKGALQELQSSQGRVLSLDDHVEEERQMRQEAAQRVGEWKDGDNLVDVGDDR